MTRRLLILPLLAGSLLAVLSACGPGEILQFQGSLRPTALREERSPGVYRLGRPLAAAAGQAFFLEYSGRSGGSTVRLLDPAGRSLGERALVDTGSEPGRILIPLPPGRPLARVSIQPPDVAGLTVRAMGFTAAEGGFSAVAGLPSAGPEISAWRREGPTWEIRLADPVAASLPGGGAGSGGGGADDGRVVPGGSPAWRLELVLELEAPPAWARFRAAEALSEEGSPAPPVAAPLYRGPERAAAILTVSDGQEARRFLFTTLPGTRTVCLYPAVVPLVPRLVRVAPLGGSRLWVQRLSLVPGGAEPAGAAGKGDQDGEAPSVRAGEQPSKGAAGREGDTGPYLPGPVEPLPADPGVVLLYDSGQWRSRSYELFVWNRFPRVLIMDTADYATQARFFKRLAFFVEKQGYRGRLATDAEIAGRHGFNAHDYRAEDLARFFQRASEEAFPLLPEELKLRSILLGNGILQLRDGRYLPGTGAVISISRGSDALLRRHLLTHEAFHGVFFSSEEYRRSAIGLWEDLDSLEREFWLLFFRWVGYDTDDSYLSANELQAYLFQQERRGVGPYFRGVTANRLLSSYPDRRSDILRFLGAEPGAFERRFDALEVPLIEAAGLEGGRVIEVTELPVR